MPVPGRRVRDSVSVFRRYKRNEVKLSRTPSAINQLPAVMNLSLSPRSAPVVRRARQACLLGLAAGWLAGCTGGSGDATRRTVEEAQAYIASLLQEVELLKKQQANLETKLRELSEPKSGQAGAPAGLPPMLSEATLEASLREASVAASKELEAALTGEGWRVENYGRPTIVMPEIFVLPYAAKVDVTASRGGRQVVLPLTLRADWNGQWQIPTRESIQQAVNSGLSSRNSVVGRSSTEEGGRSKLRDDGGETTKDAGTAKSVTTPPVGPIGPKIQGVEVKELDLRGQNLFENKGP